MMNPNENDLARDEPLQASRQSGEEEMASSAGEQFRRTSGKISTVMTQTWGQAKRKAGHARERTEYFVRENPVPTILTALGVGIAIGLAIRYASSSESHSRETELKVKSPFENVNWSFLSLPFLWPLFKTATKKYQNTSEAMKDGVKRLKKIDVDRYAKPIRKRWKAWTR